MKKLLTILLAVALCMPIAILSASCVIEDKTFQSISVDTTNAKTSYYVGDDFSSTGIIVRAKYSDKTEKTLTSSEYTINSNAYKKSEAGTYEIVVTYKGKTAKYSVKVQDSKILQEIVLDIKNAKISYYVGDNFSSTGLVVKAKYSDKTEKTLTSDDYTINSSAYRKTEAGVYEIVITYQWETEKYNVTVEETPLALAKKCLDAWEEEGYWINSIYQTSEWYKDSQKVGGEEIFASYDLQYSKYIDYTREGSFLTSLNMAAGEQWLIPSLDVDTRVEYIGYDLGTRTKKKYDTLSDATKDYNFGNMERKFWLNDYFRKAFASYLSIKDPSIVVEGSYITPENRDNFELNIDVSDTEIVVTFNVKGNDSKAVFTFDKNAFVLKSIENIKQSAASLDEEEFYDYSNGFYYFNTKPTERMKTPPVNIDWTSAN